MIHSKQPLHQTGRMPPPTRPQHMGVPRSLPALAQGGVVAGALPDDEIPGGVAPNYGMGLNGIDGQFYGSGLVPANFSDGSTPAMPPPSLLDLAYPRGDAMPPPVNPSGATSDISGVASPSPVTRGMKPASDPNAPPLLSAPGPWQKRLDEVGHQMTGTDAQGNPIIDRIHHMNTISGRPRNW